MGSREELGGWPGGRAVRGCETSQLQGKAGRPKPQGLGEGVAGVRGAAGASCMVNWSADCFAMHRYTAPFDRHDWLIDRCGVRMRYIIDFYTGRADPAAPHAPSFYIDARPALDSWEGVRMRAERFWEQWAGKLWGPSVKDKGESSGNGIR